MSNAASQFVEEYGVKFENTGPSMSEVAEALGEAFPKDPRVAIYAAYRLGAKVFENTAPSMPEVSDLVSLGLRDNKKRAHLLVSEVLGKHIPQDPRVVIYAAHLLGAKVGSVLHPELDYIESVDECSKALARHMDWELSIDELPEIPKFVSPDPEKAAAVVVGFAETATGLGFNVAEYLGEWYIHSTRHFEDREKFVAFEEEHSHATSHALVPNPKSPLLDGTIPMVLVDDEFSTGKTVQNIILAMQKKVHRNQYVIASLVDCRSLKYRIQMDEFAQEQGIDITVVSLAEGHVSVPEDMIQTVQDKVKPLARSLTTAQELFHKAGSQEGMGEDGSPRAKVHIRFCGEKAIGDTDSRVGVYPDTYLPALPEAIAGEISSLMIDKGLSLVLGQEEFMHLPLMVADSLAILQKGIRYSTTTRSPILVLDRPDYPINNGIRFKNAQNEDRFAYNVMGYTNIILVLEPGQPLSDLFNSSCDGIGHVAAGICDNLIIVGTTPDNH